MEGASTGEEACSDHLVCRVCKLERCDNRLVTNSRRAYRERFEFKEAINLVKLGLDRLEASYFKLDSKFEDARRVDTPGADAATVDRKLRLLKQYVGIVEARV